MGGVDGCQECKQLRERLDLDKQTIRGLAKSEMKYLNERDAAREEAQEYQRAAESYERLYCDEIDKRKQGERVIDVLRRALIATGVSKNTVEQVIEAAREE